MTQAEVCEAGLISGEPRLNLFIDCLIENELLLPSPPASAQQDHLRKGLKIRLLDFSNSS